MRNQWPAASLFVFFSKLTMRRPAQFAFLTSEPGNISFHAGWLWLGGILNHLH